ncbi:GFA family protein [Ectothiorhodospiraceae bacterium WFHF3C12]|nr:GFA family protein [Ectothiorhodospiraceae bacterium WFHF3C12]
MTDAFEGKGSCLCETVRFTAPEASTRVGACHCSMCRRWGGGPLLAVECGGDVRFEGDEHVSAFDSSEWAERGFCSRCGTHLFYRLKASGDYVLPAGLFDDQSVFTFTSQIFIDHKPGYYDFANQTRDLTEAQVFELYGAS